MKAHIRKEFNNLIAEDTMKEFEALLNLPDEKFSAIVGQMEGKLEEFFESPEFTTDMMNSLKSHPIEDVDAELEGIKVMVNEIDNDNTLSDDKKKFLKTIVQGGADAILKINENPREKIGVTIEKIDPNAKIPTYAHSSDAGADIYALEDTEFNAGETRIVRTGIKMAIPKGYEIQVRPRSGLSAKTGFRIANAPGTIDAGYRNEIGVIMTNTESQTARINAGDRIAQLVIAPVPMMVFTEGQVNENTDRGVGGFGSTGS